MGHKYLSYTMALILQALEHGYRYGFEVMQYTGLASGTVYPALRRLEDGLLIKSKWEKQSVAQAEQRPARKYYEVTKTGREVLAEARQRFRLLEQMTPPVELKPANEKG
ncbi:MAG: helix-turn-helix transcriptional regulator [Acidobacteria bacterium]|nr:helix-turn-helix transcriptional regulator [Acidobacteriota bacterium]MBI3427514.1 helix-turn-helix transcriptional regulator [Acidobacteriota bacterium]